MGLDQHGTAVVLRTDAEDEPRVGMPFHREGSACVLVYDRPGEPHGLRSAEDGLTDL
jgi:hypothetical protein